jgi:ATP synthase F1 complex assembly factor 2
MPLTTLSCTVLDQVCEQPQSYQASVLRYLPTDTLRFWADPTIDPHLHAEQSRLWTPILQILEERILGQPFPTTTADANVIIPNPRHGADRNSSYSIGIGSPQNSLAERCQEWVESLDAWHLGILYSLTVEAKSLALAMAYLHGGSNHRPDDVAAAADGGGVGVGGTSLLRDLWIPACRVEEEVQISQWGMVEGGHDYDRLNCSIQVHAAAFLHQCLKHERLVGRAALKPQ